jgi:hypothetical protein
MTAAKSFATIARGVFNLPSMKLAPGRATPSP